MGSGNSLKHYSNSVLYPALAQAAKPYNFFILLSFGHTEQKEREREQPTKTDKRKHWRKIWKKERAQKKIK